MYINDLNDIFVDKECHPLRIIDSDISSLLFADDIVIFSESKEGLQKCLNNFSHYCDRWQLSVNIQKTKSMIFQNRNVKLEKPFILYKNQYIENVSEYKFLGSLIKRNGNLNFSMCYLAKKAKKVMFCLYSRFSAVGNVPVDISLQLFDSLIKPILTYNADICMMDSHLPLFRTKNRARNNYKNVRFVLFY